MSTIDTYSPARVARAIRAGSRKLDPFRKVRDFGMREYLGAWYGQVPDLLARADTDKRPINLLNQFIQMHTYALVSESIQFQCKPKKWNLRGQARIRELMLNHRAGEIGLVETHRLVVLDALFSGLGVYVTGAGENADNARFKGEAYDPGEFYAGRVDLDDLSLDPFSRDRREDQWRSHRVRVRKSTLLAMYPDKADLIEKLPALRTGTSMGLDADGRSHELSGTTEAGEEWMFDEVECWDITIYEGKTARRGLLPSLDGPEGWIHEPEEYMGLEGGPYVMFGFNPVPNNTMPLPPVAAIMDLHIAMAQVGIKLVRQCLNARRVTYFDPVEEDAVLQLNDSTDDDSIKCKNPEKVRTEEYGGISSQAAAGFEWLKNEANNATANLQQGRGVSGDADTATESSNLQANMNRILAGMKADARTALTKIGKHMAWDLDTNSAIRQEFAQRMPGGGMLEMLYGPETVEGDFTEFTWDICPYDDIKGDRNLELARFQGMLQTLLPTIPGVAQMGGDVQALMRIIAQKYNEPELDEIFPTQAGMEVQQALAQKAQPPQPVGVREPKARRPIDQVRSDMAATVPGQVGAV